MLIWQPQYVAFKWSNIGSNFSYPGWVGKVVTSFGNSTSYVCISPKRPSLVLGNQVQWNNQLQLQPSQETAPTPRLLLCHKLDRSDGSIACPNQSHARIPHLFREVERLIFRIKPLHQILTLFFFGIHCNCKSLHGWAHQGMSPWGSRKIMKQFLI